MIARLITALLLIFISSAATATELSRYAANKAMQANQLAQDGNLSEAISVLKDSKPSRIYDRAYIQRMLGIFYWQSEQLQPAISALDAAISTQALSGEQQRSTERMLADLLLTDQQYRRALPHYALLAETATAPQEASELWLRNAQIHYQLQQWSQTLLAIKQYQTYHNPENVPALSLKLGAQLQLTQWPAAITTLKQLISLEPDRRNWWLQLVSLELKTGNNAEALSSLALARLQGVELQRQDLLLLARLYAQAGIPERAARVIRQLDNAENDIELLHQQASYWQQAKEWQQAIEIWQQAARINPDDYWQVARLQNQQGAYHAALDSLNRVPEQYQPAEVALAKARALYKLNRLPQALAQAQKAQRLFPSGEAEGWINYLSQLDSMGADSR